MLLPLMTSATSNLCAPRRKGKPCCHNESNKSTYHFYLPTSNLEQSGLPKQSIPPFFHSKHTVFCRSPKHCKSFSLAGNIQSLSPLGNPLLSFPLQRLSSAHLLPLTESTRSNFSGPNVSCVPGSFAARAQREPLYSPLQSTVLLLLLSLSTHGFGGLAASAALHSTAPMFWITKGLQKKWLKPIFYLPAAV